MEAELIVEKGRSVSVVGELRAEILRIQEAEKIKYNQLIVNFEKYKQFVDVEIEISKKIANQALADKQAYLDKIKELKGIIRIPRLYEQYKQRLGELTKL